SGARGSDGSGEHVFDIVAAANWDVAGFHQQLAIEDQLVPAEAGAARHLAAAAEPFGRCGGARGVADTDGILGVEHGEIAAALRFEKAALRGGVGFERVVPVEVVLRDVEADADVRAELADGFELEAGAFENIPPI